MAESPPALLAALCETQGRAGRGCAARAERVSATVAALLTGGCSSGILAATMSAQNIELQRLGVEAWSRGDVEDFLALCHPEFEWHSGGGFPGLDPVYRGHDGFRKFERDFRATWESITLTLDEIRDRGKRTAARATFAAVGRDGLRLRNPIAWITTWRDGLAVRVDVFTEWDSALEALG